ncbi:hypothetical protein M9Y10_038839 [Tritrichomonas musculus]|uniref:Integral membrane protein n=1 Tax=Tritrichomonas musculus TaxID=1915356 RepID=A0ABR2K9H9_9EUKA
MAGSILFFILSQLISGTFYAITQKVMLQIKSVGYDDVTHYFDKPFTQALLMSFSMIFSLIVRCFWDSNGKPPHPPTAFKTRLILAIPATCDLITTTLNVFGLIYINVSIFQMLRGAQIIFTSILSVIILKKRLKGYEIFGIFIVIVALTLVGFAGMYIPSSDSSDDSNGRTIKEKILGSFLVIGAQISYSIQIIIEEYFLHVKFKDNLGALEVIGNEGMMGFLIIIFIFLPFAYLCPGNDPSTMAGGSLENTWDTILMVYHKPIILVVFLLFIIFSGSYNIFCMCVIAFSSSLNEAIVDAARTLLIWVCMLISYKIGLPFGEQWNSYSLIELSGFFLLVTGSFIFDGNLKLPGCNYTITAEEQTLLDNNSKIYQTC